jgi:hypothetical protein
VLKRWWDESVDEVAYYVKGANFQVTTYVKDLKPYKEQETMKNTRVSINDNGDKVSLVTLTSEITEIEVGKNYEIKEVNGKYYAVKKKPKYPSSYEECCDILNEYSAQPNITGYKYELLDNFRKLLICRDAYWKIAGKQMGLGKPWKTDLQNKEETKFIITNVGNNITCDICMTFNTILAFPTAEMRDTFYENFKELIETCKELL